MRIALYSRISTNSERQEVLNQLQPLREWTGRLGGTVAAEYMDEASGTNGDRKQLKALLEAAHRREFDTLLIWSLDRLSREGIGRMSGYLEKLKTCGVRVLSHQEPWLDTEGPVSELLIAIFSWVAAQESRRLSERIQAGLKVARSKGRVGGRPKRHVDIKKALKLKAQGHSVRKIAQYVGVPRATLARALSQKHRVVAQSV